MGDIDRVLIPDEDGRVYPIRNVIVGSFKGDPKNYLVRNPIAINTPDHRLVGFASVYLKDTVVYADLFIIYSTPERLTLEVKSNRLYINHQLKNYGSKWVVVSLCLSEYNGGAYEVY